MKEDYNPLVTIGVLTYNSSKYVLETLESAKAQTYKNIELIISDDCSTDNTVELCRDWVDKNKERFVRCEILTVEKNTGIPANCNRRLRASKGEWIKGIAGDDILAPDCIQNFINFVKENPDAEWVSSHVQVFKGDFKAENFLKLEDRSREDFFSIESSMQYSVLLRRNPILAMGVFLKKSIVEKSGGYDESFPFLEDYPMWLKLSKSGNVCLYMKKRTAFYRIHDSSIFSSVRRGRIFNDFYKKQIVFDRVYRLPFLNMAERGIYYKNYYLRLLMDWLGLNQSNLLCKSIYWSGRPFLLLCLLLRRVDAFLVGRSS